MLFNMCLANLRGSKGHLPILNMCLVNPSDILVIIILFNLSIIPAMPSSHLYMKVIANTQSYLHMSCINLDNCEDDTAIKV